MYLPNTINLDFDWEAILLEVKVSPENSPTADLVEACALWYRPEFSPS